MAITLAGLTNGAIVDDPTNLISRYSWQGTGVFDDLMEAVNGNIHAEYANNRINATDYSTVYLGALQSVIGESINFLLNKELKEKQILDTVAGTSLKDAQRAEVLAGTSRENSIAAAEISLKGAQEDELDYKLTTLLPKEGTKLDEEIDILQSKDLEVLAGTAREDAKYYDALDTAASNRLVLGAQEALYVRQKQGFDDNKHQKVLESAMNGWSMIFSDATITPTIPDVLATDAADAGMNALFNRAAQANT